MLGEAKDAGTKLSPFSVIYPGRQQVARFYEKEAVEHSHRSIVIVEQFTRIILVPSLKGLDLQFSRSFLMDQSTGKPC